MKAVLPPAGVDGLRRAVQGWGWLTADLRMKPRILVVGAQRTGTTTLFRLLEEHPATVRPTAVKGTSFFDDEYHRGQRWYRGHFPLWITGRIKARGRRAVTFECSGYYLFHPLAAARIARDLPQVQVVVLVRDPVERAYSAHQHELARGFEDLPFEEALAQEEERIAAETAKLRTRPGYRSFEHRHHAYLGRGRYAEQIQPFLDALGPDRVHLVEAEALFADPVAEFVKLQERLGLPVWRPDQVGQWNARPRQPLASERRGDLMQHFLDQDQSLTTMLGHAPAWRSEMVR